MEHSKICDETISEKFQEPKKKFWLRSRKRPKSDAMSVYSMDISISSHTEKRKKRRRIAEVASSIFSSNKLNKTLNDSILEPSTNRKKIRLSTERPSISIRSWMFDVAELDIVSTLSRRDIKRQEAIYELFCGENLLINDLCIFRDFYYEPLLATNIFTSDEMDTIFCDVSKLIQLHIKLRDEMIELRDRSGFTDCIGPTMIEWLSHLTDPYIDRCKTQIWARFILDTKKFTCKQFQEFMKKKTVDLWTYLDSPRSRIVKYPLLLKEILRQTVAGHVDEAALKRANELLSDLLKKIDIAMGESECKLAQTRINVRPEFDPDKRIEGASDLVTQGPLKDSRGMKFYCFLFNNCLAITRANRRPGRKYNLCYPVKFGADLNVQINAAKSSPSFKVGVHTLYCDDEHHRRHWLECFKRINLPRIEAKRRSTGAVKDKENKPAEAAIESAASDEAELSIKRPKSAGNGYFSATLRKTLLRQSRSSIDNT